MRAVSEKPLGHRNFFPLNRLAIEEREAGRVDYSGGLGAPSGPERDSSAASTEHGFFYFIYRSRRQNVAGSANRTGAGGYSIRRWERSRGSRVAIGVSRLSPSSALGPLVRARPHSTAYEKQAGEMVPRTSRDAFSGALSGNRKRFADMRRRRRSTSAQR